MYSFDVFPRIQGEIEVVFGIFNNAYKFGDVLFDFCPTHALRSSSVIDRSLISTQIALTTWSRLSRLAASRSFSHE